MPDVYVEVGAVKGVPNQHLAQAQAAMRTAIQTAVTKMGSGMTTVRPADFKGIQVNIIVTSLVQDGANVNCILIGELFELPSKQRFSPGGSSKGQGKVTGKVDSAAGAAVGAAVTDLMSKIGPAIAGSQAGPAATGTANSKSPLIFIAPFNVSYPTDTKSAPSVLASRAKSAIAKMMEAKINKNTARFTLDPAAFKIGSGMPAYNIGMAVDAVTYNSGAKELVASTKGFVAEHPSGSIKVTSITSRAKQPGMSRAPREEEQIQLLVDAAETVTENAIKWILQTHP